MYYVYILESQVDGSRYVGATKDLKRRLKEHGRGNCSYTASKYPYILVWYSVFRDKTKAYNFERYLKVGSGHAFAGKHLI